MSRDSLRKHLSMPGMLRAVRACLHRIADPVDTRGISLSDCLMSDPAVFPSRMPSLLRSGRQVRGGGDPVMARNLRPLSGVGRAPSDTWMRQRLDEVDPRPPPLPHGHPRGAAARKGAGGWTLSGGHPLVPLDGTGHHSSHRVSCRSRCGRERRDRTGTYHHQALGAAIVHPDIGEVPPLAPEPIRRGDGPSGISAGSTRI